MDGCGYEELNPSPLQEQLLLTYIISAAQICSFPRVTRYCPDAPNWVLGSGSIVGSLKSTFWP